MVDRLTKHPYSDARNTVVAALALWSLAVALAASSGALDRMGAALAASLLVFMSGFAVAATTMDRRIGQWIASWEPVARVVASSAARVLAAFSAILLPLVVAPAAQAVADGLESGLSALLLVATPVLAGLAGALALAGAQESPRLVTCREAGRA